MPVYEVDSKGYIVKDKKSKRNRPVHGYMVKFQYENRTYKKTFKGITESDAKKLEAQMRMEVYSGTYGKRQQALPFSSFVNDVYLPHVKKSVPSAYNYERLFPILCGYFKNKPLNEITAADVDGFRRHRQTTPKRGGGTRSLNTINREVAELSALFSYAVRLDYCPVNPCSKVKRYKVSNRRERVLHPEEEQNLMAALTGTKAKYRPLVILYLHTGMRLSQVVLMKWGWIDFKLRQITLPIPNNKNRKPHIVSLNDNALAVLLELCPDGDPEKVAEWREKRVFTEPGLKRSCNVSQAICKLCDDIGLPDVTTHTFRHTANTRMLEAGGNPIVVAAQMGHSSTRMTEHYAHISDKAQLRVAKTLEKQ